jgi:hypothetical protein
VSHHAPGTLVVAPATRSSPTSETVDVYRSLEQYGASLFIDVISFHANGGPGHTSNEAWSRINSRLYTIRARNPGNLNKPAWITEFGWPSSDEGQQLQRDKIEAIAQKWTMGTFRASGNGTTDGGLNRR